MMSYNQRIGLYTGREIAPNTGANATKIFTLATKSWELVAMLAQLETWSDYKYHNTLKLLVGVTPNGQVTFLSDLWGGRVSDKQITRESGVLDLLQVGDNVMVDRGFDISAIVPAGVTVNMPPFLAGRDQMTAAETEETMSIASVRIHVEREIGRIKTYHILDGTLPNTNKKFPLYFI